MAAGFLFTALAGTLFHFLYDWSHQNAIVGLFTPVNESVWEHIKLLYFPMLLFAVFATRKWKSFFPCIGYALSAGILFGCLLIPVLYYTYTGIFGVQITAVDIAIFYISTFTAFLSAYHLANTCRGQKQNRLVRPLVILLGAAFFTFTFFPPALPLFASP